MDFVTGLEKNGRLVRLFVSKSNACYAGRVIMFQLDWFGSNNGDVGRNLCSQSQLVHCVQTADVRNTFSVK